MLVSAAEGGGVFLRTPTGAIRTLGSRWGTPQTLFCLLVTEFLKTPLSRRLFLALFELTDIDLIASRERAPDAQLVVEGT